MSIILREKLKCEMEEKYKIDFLELDSLSKSIKEKYYIDETLKLLFETYIGDNERFISIECLKRKRIIE